MKVIIDRESAAFGRITSAGFEILEPYIWIWHKSDSYNIFCNFRCVCGKIEPYIEKVNIEALHARTIDLSSFQLKYIDSQTLILDSAQHMEDNEAISVEHLKKDGYTDEEIKQIRRAYG